MAKLKRKPKGALQGTQSVGTRKPPVKKAPEITRDLLTERQAAMTQQLGRILEDVAKVQGALQMTQMLIDYLDGKATAMNPQQDHMPSPEEMKRMRAESKAAQDAIDAAKAKTADAKPKAKPRAKQKPKPPALKDATTA